MFFAYTMPSWLICRLSRLSGVILSEVYTVWYFDNYDLLVDDTWYLGGYLGMDVCANKYHSVPPPVWFQIVAKITLDKLEFGTC